MTFFGKTILFYRGYSDTSIANSVPKTPLVRGREALGLDGMKGRVRRRASKSYFKNKLKKCLKRTRLRDLLIQVWSVENLRRGTPEVASRFLRFPRDAVSANPGTPYFIAPWTLETLINEALVNQSASPNTRRYLDTSRWESFARLYNLVNDIENSESLDDIPDSGIVDAVPRIGWRQFGWQTGYQSSQRYFRAWWLYNFSEASEFFQESYGITVERFGFVGFAVASQLISHPAVKIDAKLHEIGIKEEERDAFFKLVSLGETEAKKEARAQRRGRGQIAYKPSLLRAWPMIEVGGEAFCPLPELLHLRVSDGIFYNLVGSDDLRRIIAERFEAYVAEVTQHYMPGFRILKETQYGPRSRSRATPDLRITTNKNEICAIIECKARRIPFKVMSSPDPYIEHEDIYTELVKGVIQVWRYVSDLRTGSADDDWPFNEGVVGVVLMLEPWLQMHAGTIRKILDAAAVDRGKYPDIAEEDQIPIAFVAVDDWEYSIRQTDADGFIRALSLHATADKAGYLLDSSVQEIKAEHGPSVGDYDYRAGIARVTDWWADLEQGRVPGGSSQ